MRKGIVFLTVSLLLILLSVQPLYLMGQEVLLQQTVNSQYKIENIYHPVDMTTDPFKKLQYLQDGMMKPFPEMKREIFVNGKEISDYSEFMNGVNVSEGNQLSRIISFYNTDITLVDTFTGTEEPDVREKSKVQILIQGMNYAEPVSLEIRPTHLDNNRYHGYLGMLKMTNHSTKEEDLIIIQRLFEDSFSTSEKDFKWKVISINKGGSVKTDIFTREDIDNPSYRRDLIVKATVSPYALGYKSNILQSYPSLFFPFLYPFGTMVIGIILLVIGLFLEKKRRQ
ncbi:hypothetical protein GN156_16870 [bacterium LRH843]|nr:hypothetical protein [bacterium LRH843]